MRYGESTSLLRSTPSLLLEQATHAPGSFERRWRLYLPHLADISHPAQNADRPERRLAAGLSRSPATRGANRPASFLLAALSRLEAGAPDSFGVHPLEPVLVAS